MGTRQQLSPLLFIKVTVRIPAIALEVYFALRRELDAFSFEELLHPSFLAESPASAELALTVDNPLSWHLLRVRSGIHEPPYHARAMRVAYGRTEPAIRGHPTSRARSNQGIHLRGQGSHFIFRNNRFGHT